MFVLRTDTTKPEPTDDVDELLEALANVTLGQPEASAQENMIHPRVRRKRRKKKKRQSAGLACERIEPLGDPAPPQAPIPPVAEVIDLTLSDDDETPAVPTWPCYQAEHIPSSFLKKLKRDAISREKDMELQRFLRAVKIQERNVGKGNDAPILQIDNIPVSISQIEELLRPGSWLNDESINGLFALLQTRYPRTRFFNTFFYPALFKEGVYSYKAVRRWTRKHANGVFSFDRAVIPINKGNYHWCLVTVDLVEHRIAFHDSMGSSARYGSKVMATIRQYLLDEEKDKQRSGMQSVGNIRPSPKLWTASSPPCPQQQDGGSCGVFTCLFAKRFAMGREMDFSQSDVDQYRRKIAWDLVGLRLCSEKAQHAANPARRIALFFFWSIAIAGIVFTHPRKIPRMDWSRSISLALTLPQEIEHRDDTQYLTTNVTATTVGGHKQREALSTPTIRDPVTEKSARLQRSAPSRGSAIPEAP
ncbi:uncharacterized protein EV422DRAFT_576835 [Fimicolochytrium jonesii]|uniref:uncharacterized protein n=1 Tax=Fimicolochytrium jonesii TaxID=1396493 RepID=UPI0022FDF5AA|nr:uncharacterized protein EV422DRAFT_576835 [Fimicolochytrium jonesii]KAI8824465.1 hypothetical protein EV422DRAFT_576835 [Fimicolochytrium jonesii]